MLPDPPKAFWFYTRLGVPRLASGVRDLIGDANYFQSGQTPKQKMATARSGSAIPLSCTACPKRQKFSDISHLLTHINSKGHLHAHQLLKIRARNDAAAADILQQYNKWYDDNGIEKLLADRLAQRDEKEAGKKRRTGDDYEPVSVHPYPRREWP